MKVRRGEVKEGVEVIARVWASSGMVEVIVRVWAIVLTSSRMCMCMCMCMCM